MIALFTLFLVFVDSLPPEIESMTEWYFLKNIFQSGVDFMLIPTTAIYQQ